MFIHQEVEQLYLNNFILYMGNVGTSLTSLCYKMEIKIYILLGILTKNIIIITFIHNFYLKKNNNEKSSIYTESNEVSCMFVTIHHNIYDKK